MPVGIYMMNKGFTPEKYTEAIRQLDAAGAGAPAGRTHHIAMAADGTTNVFDIWESTDAFEAFGPTLMPILTGLGVEPGESMILPVQNVIEA